MQMPLIAAMKGLGLRENGIAPGATPARAAGCLALPSPRALLSARSFRSMPALKARPGAGDDADAHLRVGAEVVEGLVEVPVHRAAEGVEALGPVHGEDGVVVVLFVEKVWHVSTPFWQWLRSREA